MVKKISTLLASALFLLGCNSHNDTLSEDVGLYLNVSTDLTYKVSEEDYNVGRANFDLSSIVTVPSVADFKMSLYSVVDEGLETLLNSWESVNDFQEGSQFAPGDYRVVVDCGEYTEEGENKPYFYGSKYFEVEPDEVTTVNIVAELCNSFIKVTATNDFKEYFTSGTISVTSAGRNDVVLNPLTNSTPAFVRPGVVDLVWEGVRQGGAATAVVASQLNLVAKTGYTLNLDVDASNNQIIVQYNNDVTTSYVDLIASNDPLVELPYMESVGFISGTSLNFSKASPIESVRMVMVADGKIKDCVLTLNAVTATALRCDEQMSLISTTVQSLMSTNGLKIKGLDSKRDRMAYIEFADMLKGLSVGSYSFSVVLLDTYNRVTSPMVLKVNVTE